MTKRKVPAPAEGKAVVISAYEGETEAQTMGRALIEPYFRHGAVAHAVLGKMLGKIPGDAQFDDFGRAMQAKAKATGEGNMALPSEMLTTQALTLDALFTEFARRATNNMGDYVQTAERYGRLAFKAQSNCRATLEALAKLHQPREQTVKHVHVNEGGQAVVADHIHQHTGGQENAKSNEQSHATDPAGASAALPGPDPLGDGVSIVSGEREAAMQDARRGYPRPSPMTISIADRGDCFERIAMDSKQQGKPLTHSARAREGVARSQGRLARTPLRSSRNNANTAFLLGRHYVTREAGDLAQYAHAHAREAPDKTRRGEVQQHLTSGCAKQGDGAAGGRETLAARQKRIAALEVGKRVKQ